jgi:hypothetical protein
MQPESIPPDSMRAEKIVEGEWREINRMIWDAMPFEHRVSSIDQFLEGRENDIQSLALPGPYDWMSDLQRAEYIHKFNKDWIKRNEKARDDHIQYWKDLSRRANEFAEKVSLGGFNTIILLHGAVAVGALNIISKKPTEVSSAAMNAALFGLIAALVGILLAAFGMLAFFHFLATISNTVSVITQALARTGFR